MSFPRLSHLAARKNPPKKLLGNSFSGLAVTSGGGSSSDFGFNDL
jgi:hypothetical protein